MSVVDNLFAMRGVWHDRLQGFHPDGSPMDFDEHGGTPGPFPYENLVYIDFDGTTYEQTNVAIAGRPLHVRSFRATVADGVLRFGQLGVGDPGHVGVSGGPGVLVFTPGVIDDSLKRFSDPDFILLSGPMERPTTRLRVTTLYRYARIVRVLRVDGVRLGDDPTRRWAEDPRGANGAVHEVPSTTMVYEAGATDAR